MDKQELNKNIEKTVLKMALEPNNVALYHELAKYYAMDNQFEKVVQSMTVGKLGKNSNSFGKYRF